MKRLFGIGLAAAALCAGCALEATSESDDAVLTRSDPRVVVGPGAGVRGPTALAAGSSADQGSADGGSQSATGPTREPDPAPWLPLDPAGGGGGSGSEPDPAPWHTASSGSVANQGLSDQSGGTTRPTPLPSGHLHVPYGIE